jgi:mono/diheme cytochrome c family protein
MANRKLKSTQKSGGLLIAVIVGIGLIGAGFLYLNFTTDTPSSSTLPGNTDLPPVPTLDAQRVAQGQPLYNQYCATCHGTEGEGQPDWKVRNEDGSLKSPPHDADGHTWHHDDELLLNLIANGSDFPESQMPTFGDTLSDEEIIAIIEYIKTWWGPQERTFQWQVTWQAEQLK